MLLNLAMVFHEALKKFKVLRGQKNGSHEC